MSASSFVTFFFCFILLRPFLSIVIVYTLCLYIFILSTPASPQILLICLVLSHFLSLYHISESNPLFLSQFLDLYVHPIPIIPNIYLSSASPFYLPFRQNSPFYHRLSHDVSFLLLCKSVHHKS